MKRKVLPIIILLLITLCAIYLTGCTTNKEYKEYKPEYGPQFILLENYTDPYLSDVQILVDKTTRVMYLYIHCQSCEYSGITPLYDSEGNIRKYNGAIIE